MPKPLDGNPHMSYISDSLVSRPGSRVWKKVTSRGGLLQTWQQPRGLIQHFINQHMRLTLMFGDADSFKMAC